jgi:hypothetical protein
MLAGKERKGSFHNLSHLENSDGERDIEEEEYQWLKKRNAKLQQKENTKNRGKGIVSEAEIDKENYPKEAENKQSSFQTPKKDVKEEPAAVRVFTPRDLKNTTLLTVKATLKSPTQQRQSQTQTQPQPQRGIDAVDDFVKVLSPLMERIPSNLSLESFSELSPQRDRLRPASRGKEQQQQRQQQEEQRFESKRRTPEPKTRLERNHESKVSVEDVEESDAEADDAPEEKEEKAVAESKYSQEEMEIDQLFSKVRHNRLRQVSDLLEGGLIDCSLVKVSFSLCLSLSLSLSSPSWLCRIASATIFCICVLKTISRRWPRFVSLTEQTSTPPTRKDSHRWTTVTCTTSTSWRSGL